MSANIKVTLSSDKLEVAAGVTVEATVSIRNQSQIVDQFAIKVDGLDPTWWSLSVSSVSLFPGDQDEAKLTIRPPKEAEAKAGSYSFQVKVVSQANPQDSTMAEAYLVLKGFTSWEAEMAPSKIVGRSGTYRIKVNNSGNSDASIVFEAKDSEEGLYYTFAPNAATVPAGNSSQVNLTVKPKKGEPKKQYSFQVMLKPADSKAPSREVKMLNGQLEYPKGRNLWWLLLLLIPILIVAAVLMWNFVLKPTIDLVSPNGGEYWASGSKQNILWTAKGFGVDTIDLEISRDGGTTWQPIASNLPNTGSYQWLIETYPKTSANCLVKATIKGPAKRPLGQDTSRSFFTMAASAVNTSIAVINPVGGMKFNSGDSIDINWTTTGSGVTSITLHYSTDGGKQWESIPGATNVPNNGKYTWKIPSIDTSSTCYVKVIAHGADKAVIGVATNSSPFTIQGGYFILPLIPATQNWHLFETK
jgi:hypothetical protein